MNKKLTYSFCYSQERVLFGYKGEVSLLFAFFEQGTEVCIAVIKSGAIRNFANFSFIQHLLSAASFVLDMNHVLRIQHNQISFVEFHSLVLYSKRPKALGKSG